MDSLTLESTVLTFPHLNHTVVSVHKMPVITFKALNGSLVSAPCYKLCRYPCSIISGGVPVALCFNAPLTSPIKSKNVHLWTRWDGYMDQTHMRLSPMTTGVCVSCETCIHVDFLLRCHIVTYVCYVMLHYAT